MIVLITAFKHETDYLKKVIKTEILPGHPFKTLSGKLGRQKIIIIEGGVGKTLSAAAAQYVCSVFKSKLIVNIGVCGGIKEGIQIGDVIYATETEEYDLTFNIVGTVWKQNESRINPIKKMLPDLFYGKIVSADRNVEDSHTKKKLIKKYNAFGGDWESAAIARICKLNKKPCIILRAVSDLADENFITDFSANIEPGMKNAFDALKKILKII